MKRALLPFALVTLVACLEPLGLLSSADAQQPAAPRRVGVLLVGTSPEGKGAQSFRQGLRDAGYAEGRDVVIEWRYANGDYVRVPELAADLVQGKVDVIVVDSTLGTQAVKRATSTIPIVMSFVGDPVGSGLVASLAHPGGNVTGFSTMAAELSTKRLQLLKAVMPRLARVTVLWNPDTPWNRTAIEALKAAAPSLAIKLNFVCVQKSEEFDAVFAALRGHTQALCLLGSPLFFSHQATLARLAAKARLPAIFEERKFAEEGGLMSYGASYADLFRRSAGYIDRILKGAKPSDLPIEQPTKFEFVVNLKTAKALGLTIPESILLRADEVIR